MRTCTEANCLKLLESRGVSINAIPTPIYEGVIAAMQAAFEYGKQAEVMHVTYRPAKKEQ